MKKKKVLFYYLEFIYYDTIYPVELECCTLKVALMYVFIKYESIQIKVSKYKYNISVPLLFMCFIL